jgi:tetratricopeptide (TPR) repeat protein
MLQVSSNDPSLAEKSHGSYTRAIMLDNKLVRARLGLAELEASAGKHEAASQLYKEVLEIDPLNFDAQRGLAASHEGLARVDAAEDRNRMNTKLLPECWYTHNHLGAFYLRHGRYPDAENQFLQVIKLAPDNRIAHHNLALLYNKMGQYPEALQTAQRALRLGSGAFAYLALGTAYYNLRCFERAIESLKAAVESDLANHLAWTRLADVYLEAPGRRPDAAAARLRAIQLGRKRLAQHPGDALVQITLAVNLAKTNERDEALSHIRAALNSAPNHTDVLFHAGIVYELAGDRTTALALLERALRQGYSAHNLTHSTDLTHLLASVEFRQTLRRIGIDIRTLKAATPTAANPCGTLLVREGGS